MMICLNKYIIVLYFHLLAWNRINANPINLDGHNSTSSSAFEEISGLNYAEGGVFKETITNASSTSPRTSLEGVKKNGTNTSLQDLLENGLPLTGTSKVKPRKEAPPRTIVARKGAPPCLENDNTPCDDKLSFSNESSSKSPIIVHPEKNSSAATSSPLRIDLLSKINSTTNSPKKPKVTMVQADSDEFLAKLKNDRNVVIPVAALVCTPILVLLALLIYKRIDDSRGNSRYTRMSYLIEDIYND